MTLPKRTIEFSDVVNGVQVHVVAKDFFEDRSVGIGLQPENLAVFVDGVEIDVDQAEDDRLCEKAVTQYEDWRRNGRTSPGRV